MSSSEQFIDHSKDNDHIIIFAVVRLDYEHDYYDQFLFVTLLKSLTNYKFKKWVNNYCIAHPHLTLGFIFHNNSFALGSNEYPRFRYYKDHKFIN